MNDLSSKFSKQDLMELAQTDPEFIAQLEQDHGVVITITGEFREVKSKKVRNALKKGAEAGKETGTKTVVKAALGAGKTKDRLEYVLKHAPKEKVREFKASRPSQEEKEAAQAAKQAEREAAQAEREAAKEAEHQEALRRAEQRKAEREAAKAAKAAAKAAEAQEQAEQANEG